MIIEIKGRVFLSFFITSVTFINDHVLWWEKLLCDIHPITPTYNMEKAFNSSWMTIKFLLIQVKETSSHSPSLWMDQDQD